MLNGREIERYQRHGSSDGHEYEYGNKQQGTHRNWRDELNEYGLEERFTEARARDPTRERETSHSKTPDRRHKDRDKDERRESERRETASRRGESTSSHSKAPEADGDARKERREPRREEDREKEQKAFQELVRRHLAHIASGANESLKAQINQWAVTHADRRGQSAMRRVLREFGDEEHFSYGEEIYKITMEVIEALGHATKQKMDDWDGTLYKVRKCCPQLSDQLQTHKHPPARPSQERHERSSQSAKRSRSPPGSEGARKQKQQRTSEGPLSADSEGTRKQKQQRTSEGPDVRQRTSERTSEGRDVRQRTSERTSEGRDVRQGTPEGSERRSESSRRGAVGVAGAEVDRSSQSREPGIVGLPFSCDIDIADNRDTSDDVTYSPLQPDPSVTQENDEETLDIGMGWGSWGGGGGEEEAHVSEYEFRKFKSDGCRLMVKINGSLKTPFYERTMRSAFFIFHRFQWASKYPEYAFPREDLPMLAVACMQVAGKACNNSLSVKYCIEICEHLDKRLPPFLKVERGMFPPSLGRMPTVETVALYEFKIAACLLADTNICLTTPYECIGEVLHKLNAPKPVWRCVHEFMRTQAYTDSDLCIQEDHPAVICAILMFMNEMTREHKDDWWSLPGNMLDLVEGRQWVKVRDFACQLARTAMDAENFLSAQPFIDAVIELPKEEKDKRPEPQGEKTPTHESNKTPVQSNKTPVQQSSKTPVSVHAACGSSVTRVLGRARPT